jgi:DNA-binding Xre family transcriptional regulator
MRVVRVIVYSMLNLLCFRTTRISKGYATCDGEIMASKRTAFDEILIAIGDNIRRYRTDRGYTLDQLGCDIGLDKSNMYRIEQGKNITLLTLIKIAAILEVTPDELLRSDIILKQEDAEAFMKSKSKKV